MESQTYIKNLRISPKKMRFILDEIKKLKPAEALDYLYYTPKRTARIFYKAVKSAVTNAKNVLKVDESQLKFKLLTVEEGQILKRYRSGGRGTVKSIKKRYAHVKVIITSIQPEQKSPAPKVLPKPEQKIEVKASKKAKNPKLAVKKAKA